MHDRVLHDIGHALGVQEVNHYGIHEIKASTQGIKKLTLAAQREKLFLKHVPIKPTEIHADFSNKSQDPVANEILAKFHMNSNAALRSTGDGDCLFNSFSLLLAGDESLSLELRYRCCIEMVTNGAKIKRDGRYSRFSDLSPDFEQDCIDCARPYSYSPVWRIMALSNVLNLKVESVYPCVNGSKHVAFRALNTTFRPTFADPTKPTLTIMWTSMSYPVNNSVVSKRGRNVDWFPNHFVPLVDLPTKKAEQTAPCESYLSPNRYATLQSEHDDIIAPETNCSDTSNDCRYLDASDIKTERNCENRISAHCEEDIIDGDMPSRQTDLSTINEESFQSEMEEDGINGGDMPSIQPTGINHSNISSSSSSSNNDTLDTDLENNTDLNEDGPLKNKFLDLNETLLIFRGPYSVLNEIPVGRKSNTYFVINNSENSDKRSKGQKSEFWDDCGSWKKGSSPKSLYVQTDNKLKSIVKKDGIFCTEIMSNRKRTFVPIQPQPSEGEILEVHRLYTTLKASPLGPSQFKKKVTWFGHVPSSVQTLPTDVAIVEYIGVFPERQFHGNVKKPSGNEHFIKTKESMRTEIKQIVKNMPPKEVERQFNIRTKDDFEKQRNIDQIRNFKYNEDKKARTSSLSRNNAADHLLSVENMVQEHDFVRAVQHHKGMPPSVIIYTEQQIRDIKRLYCKDGGTVLGLDKTYNLGDFHVTPSVYKNLSVIKKSTNEHPITFGPTFIHSNSSTKTYSSFMHHIADQLTDTELSHLVIGSDDKHAIKASVRRCFPGAVHVLCTRHLRQNAKDFMEHQVGIPIKERQIVLNELFGDKGLTSATDIDTYESRLKTIKQLISANDDKVGEKKFEPYFDTRLLPLIKNHVIEPSKNGKINSYWTNNNCESPNHILKSATNWKQSSLPDFIKTMYNIIQSEKEETCRAIRGCGNFTLHESFRHHRTDIDTWVSWTEDHKRKTEDKFLNDKGRRLNQTVSSDGTRTILRTPTAGKKPNQVKIKRAERSRTPNAKRKLVE